MSDEIIETPPCPLCGGSVRMSDMDDEDDRRFWFRTVRCDNCDLTLKSGIGWKEYSSLGPDKAAEKVAAMLMETWGGRPGLAALVAENERLAHERDRNQASRRWHMQKRRLAEADLAAARAEMAEKGRDCARGA